MKLEDEIRKAEEIRSALVDSLQIMGKMEVVRLEVKRVMHGKAPLKPVLTPKEKAIMNHLKNLQNLTRFCQDQKNYGRFYEYYRTVRLEGLHKNYFSAAKYKIHRKNKIAWMGIVGLEDQHHATLVLPLIAAINKYNPLLTVLRRIYEDLETRWLVGVNDNVQAYTKGVIEGCIQLSVEYIKKLHEAGRADLAKEISKNTHIRNLRYHNEIVNEIAKFMVVMQRTSFPDNHQIWTHADPASVKDSRARAWNQFIRNRGPYMEGYGKTGYVYLLKKKKLQKMFEQWGDDDVSKKLSEFYHEHKQDNHAWAEFLTRLHLEKTDPHYINQYVLLPAKKAIVEIIEKDMKEMIQKQGEEADDLQNAIQKAMEDLSKGKKSVPPQVKKEFGKRNQSFEDMYKGLEKQWNALNEIIDITPQLRQLERNRNEKNTAASQLPARVQYLARANPKTLGQYLGSSLYFASHYVHSNDNQEKMKRNLQSVPSRFITKSRKVAETLVALERMYLLLFHFLESEHIRVEIEPSLKKWQVTKKVNSLVQSQSQVRRVA